MLDTNVITQAGETVSALHAQLQLNWPAISAAAVIIARELGNLNRWLVSVAEYIIRHGGAIMILRKLIWNPSAGVPPVANNPTAQLPNHPPYSPPV